jgi:hypothetical protein
LFQRKREAMLKRCKKGEVINSIYLI